MPEVTVIYGEEVERVEVSDGSVVGDAIVATGLPLEQPCAGRGTCGQCTILAGHGLAGPDDVELANLTAGERALGNRLACRARVQAKTQVTLAPVVVYSNKVFRAGNRYKLERDAPLGLAVDLGSTTVAALLTMLDEGEVCVGAAALNQQTVFGADVIARLDAAMNSAETAARLQQLALASINQAINALKLTDHTWARIERVAIVGNVAMHHLLAELSLDTLVALPFQPQSKAMVCDAKYLTGGIFPPNARVILPPLIGGFVGSDALACLAYFGFERASGPMAAIDLGTNGEVMVTDGNRILTASTAAGPAFEGVNISCGTRAVDGAIVAAEIEEDGWRFETIAAASPTGVTGSGLLSIVHALRRAKVIDASGRIVAEPPIFADAIDLDSHGARRLPLDRKKGLFLSQWDVRELQKAKGAIRAATDILVGQLGLRPVDLEQVVLTGSFGGQIDVDVALALGLIPSVAPETVKMIANGAGLGAAMFLTDEGLVLSKRLADRTEQIDLDLDADFNMRFISSMALVPGP